MWYHPAVFVLSWRDVAAAWILCLVVAAALIGHCPAEDEAESPAATAKSAIEGAVHHAQKADGADANFST